MSTETSAALLAQIKAGAQTAAENVVDLEPYRDDNGKIIAPKLAAFIARETPVASGSEILYHYKGGVYQPATKAIRARVLDLAGSNWTRHLEGEVLGNLRAGAPDLWDRPPLDKINVRNGIYCLSTNKLEPHTAEHLSPVQLNVEFDPNAECPTIQRWLVDTLDDKVATLLLEVIAYLLTPDNRHHRAFMCMGPAGAGKSTALTMIEALLGDSNVSHVGLQQLDEHRFATAELYGRLANIHADLPSRAVKGTSTFKCITGGDPIMGERKGRDPFTFTPYARLVFSANETPPTHDGTEAYFDRWTILPFSKKFRGTKHQDRDLGAKLTTPTELSGLLNLALPAVHDVRRNGFTIGAAAQAQKEQFRLDSDPVAAFVDECCELDPDATTSRADLYRAYSTWCKDSGRHPHNAANFTHRIREHHEGVVTEITIRGNRSWRGLTLTGASA